MRFFIVKNENASYYYENRKGILRKNLQSLHDPAEIYPSGKDGFALCSLNGINLVCSNRNNDIIYIQNAAKPYVIVNGKKDIVPYNFSLTVCDNGLNLFYLTDYDDRVFLYHCVLGKSLHPHLIAELSPNASDYYCEYNRIYYTSSENMLCCRLINGEIANRYTEICYGGITPCYTEHQGKGFLAYKKGDTIYINNQPVAEDKRSSSPVIFIKNNAMYVQWTSGNRIRYRRYENGTASDIIQCLGPDNEPHIINIIDGHNNPCYGHCGRPSINF